MTIEEIIEKHFNKPRDKKKTIGRYWASEVHSIMKCYTNPTNYLKEKRIEEEGGFNIFWGQAAEAQLDRIFTDQAVDCITQEPFELKIDDFIVSGKTDFSFKNFVLETKCPRDITTEIPEKWKAQLEIYHRAFNKPVKLGIFNKQGTKIIKFYNYEPSEDFWKRIQETLRDFDAKLKKKHAM